MIPLLLGSLQEGPTGFPFLQLGLLPGVLLMALATWWAGSLQAPWKK